MLTQPNRLANRQWKMLLVYNIYRLMTIVTLFVLLWVSSYNQTNQQYYNILLGTYLCFGLVCLYIGQKRLIHIERQVLWFGTIDILLIAWFINSIGHLESGFGVILFATIAVISILSPGKIAIYFASVASITLLLINLFDYQYNLDYDLAPFFATGIYGAGFFATALTTWYLASRVRISEQMAEQWSNELISILRIGEYFIEQVKNGVVYVESDGIVRLINNTARQYFNLKKNKLPDFLQDALPMLYPAYTAFISKQKKRRDAYHTVLPEHNLRVDFFSVSIDGHTSVLMILEDLAMIEQQAQQFKLASLGRFSASIAHELRNPLGVISHAAQLLGEEHEIDEETTRLKELILNNCNRMNRVIKNVLQLTRQQSSKPETIELSSYLKLFKNEFMLIHPCKMVMHLPKHKKNIQFDKSQLDQVLVVLCENAMIHGADKEGHVVITFAIERSNQGLMLTVSDTGIGIPYSKRDMVFEPFYTTNVNGNGMGLFIAKDLCELNGARLILNQTGHGCSFSIIFSKRNEGRL